MLPHETDVAQGGIQLSADVSAPARARHLFEDLAAHLPPEMVDRGELLISEAVTNSVNHGSRGPGDPTQVSVEIDDERVRVEVADAMPFRAPLRPRDPSWSGGGLGLFLIDQLADRWGSTPRERGKVVWFELNVPTPTDGSDPDG